MDPTSNIPPPPDGSGIVAQAGGIPPPPDGSAIIASGAKSAPALQPYSLKNFGRYTTEENYPTWAATPPKAGPYIKPGEREAWTGAHLSPMDTLNASLQGPAMAAATVAPMLTGGASLPVQAAVMGASGAAQAKLTGGSNKQAGVSAALGAALPVVGAGVGALAEALPSTARAGAALQEIGRAH